MRMAARELQRRPRAFLVPASILGMLALLLLYPSSILDGIVEEVTAAVRHAPADLVAYSHEANGVMARSTIEPAVRERVASVPGTSTVATFDVALFGATMEGSPEPLALALTTSNEPLAERKPAPGEGIADASLRSLGVTEGTKFEVGPLKVPITVVGFTSQSNLWFAKGMIVHKSTWLATFAPLPETGAAGADAAEERSSQALLIKVEEGNDPAVVAEAIDQTTSRETQTMTREIAVRTTPGVQEQETTFGYMRLITLTVALVVVALFLSFMTLERAPLYAALKAIGASSRQLYEALVFQVLLITGFAVTSAALVTFMLTRLPFKLQTIMEPRRVIETTMALALTAVIGSAVSLRRVTSVDAKDAIG